MIQKRFGSIVSEFGPWAPDAYTTPGKCASGRCRIGNCDGIAVAMTRRYDDWPGRRRLPAPLAYCAKHCRSSIRQNLPPAFDAVAELFVRMAARSDT